MAQAHTRAIRREAPPLGTTLTCPVMPLHGRTEPLDGGDGAALGLGDPLADRGAPQPGAYAAGELAGPALGRAHDEGDMMPRGLCLLACPAAPGPRCRRRRPGGALAARRGHPHLARRHAALRAARTGEAESGDHPVRRRPRRAPDPRRRQLRLGQRQLPRALARALRRARPRGGRPRRAVGSAARAGAGYPAVKRPIPVSRASSSRGLSAAPCRCRQGGGVGGPPCPASDSEPVCHVAASRAERPGGGLSPEPVTEIAQPRPRGVDGHDTAWPQRRHERTSTRRNSSETEGPLPCRRSATVELHGGVTNASAEASLFSTCGYTDDGEEAVRP